MPKALLNFPGRTSQAMNKLPNRWLILVMLLCCYQSPVSAATDALSVEAVGEAAGSDLESPREVCGRAKAEAQRSAIEQAVGSFVRSHTIVSNSQLADDLILAQVRGRIESLEVLQEERTSVGCRVRIKALIRPEYPNGKDAIQIKAAMARSELREGDEVSVQYQINRDGYIYIFVIAADSSVTQLLPNAMVRENRLRAGELQQFPPQNSGIRLRAQLQQASKKSGAAERLKIIVTRQPELILERGFQEGFAVYDAKSTALISDLLKRLAQLEPADWGEVTLEYRITP